jgi:uncharacterized protein
MSPHEFTIPVHDLDAAGRAVHFPIRVAWLRAVLEGTDVGPADADGSLELRVSKSGNDVVVHGTVQAELTVPCARCLEPARVVIREPVSALAVQGPAAPTPAEGEEEDMSPDDADTIAYDGDTVVLDDLVRDELLLAIPMIPLCSESCPGISPGSATKADDAGIDPRLRPLLKLKKT